MNKGTRVETPVKSPLTAWGVYLSVSSFFLSKSRSPEMSQWLWSWITPSSLIFYYIFMKSFLQRVHTMCYPIDSSCLQVLKLKMTERGDWKQLAKLPKVEAGERPPAAKWSPFLSSALVHTCYLWNGAEKYCYIFRSSETLVTSLAFFAALTSCV